MAPGGPPAAVRASPSALTAASGSPPATASGSLPVDARSVPGAADLDPTNDTVVAPPEPIVDCEERLKTAGIEFSRAKLPVRPQRGGYVCGAEDVVTYRRSSEKIRWNAEPLVTCAMAIALGRFETIAQEEALRVLGKRIARIEQGGTYSCRKMARFRLVSEHSYANAIDVRTLTLEDGRRVSVEKHFGALDREPERDEGRFLRGLARRLYDEDIFSVVLTRYFDELHRDHFHFDQARYRIDGTR